LPVTMALGRDLWQERRSPGEPGRRLARHGTSQPGWARCPAVVPSAALVGWWRASSWVNIPLARAASGGLHFPPYPPGRCLSCPLPAGAGGSSAPLGSQGYVGGGPPCSPFLDLLVVGSTKRRPGTSRCGRRGARHRHRWRVVVLLFLLWESRARTRLVNLGLALPRHPSSPPSVQACPRRGSGWSPTLVDGNS